MDLYFSRRRFFETSLHAPCGKTAGDGSSDLKEVYRVSTTVRRRSNFPDKTTIEYVAAEDEEKDCVVATIEWRWPSRISSIIEIDGKRLTLKDFMKREEGLLNTGTHVMIDDERFTWRSAVFRTTQLYDSQNRPVARFSPQVHGLQPLSRALTVEPGCLHLEPDVATDAYARDFAVASFFVYQACRDWRILLTPWWRDEQADFNGMKLKAQEEQ